MFEDATGLTFGGSNYLTIFLVAQTLASGMVAISKNVSGRFFFKHQVGGEWAPRHGTAGILQRYLLLDIVPRFSGALVQSCAIERRRSHWRWSHLNMALALVGENE